MNKEFIKFEDLFHAVKKRWSVIVICTIVCTVIALAIAVFLIKPQYQDSTAVFVGKGETSSQALENPNYYKEVKMYQQLMGTYQGLVDTDNNIIAALKASGQNTDNKSINKTLGAVTVKQNNQIIDITYKSNNQNEVVPFLTTLTNEFIKNSATLLPNIHLEVIEAAKNPPTQLPAHKTRIVAGGIVLGIILGIGLAILMEFLDKTIKTSDELEHVLGIPVLGSIPKSE